MHLLLIPEHFIKHSLGVCLLLELVEDALDYLHRDPLGWVLWIRDALMVNTAFERKFLLVALALLIDGRVDE